MFGNEADSGKFEDTEDWVLRGIQCSWLLQQSKLIEFNLTLKFAINKKSTSRMNANHCHKRLHAFSVKIIFSFSMISDIDNFLFKFQFFFQKHMKITFTCIVSPIQISNMAIQVRFFNWWLKRKKIVSRVACCMGHEEEKWLQNVINSFI